MQCIHYSLTQPAVAAVVAGYDAPKHVEQAVAYETASDEEKDYATVFARAPKHTFGQGECTCCGHRKPCPANIDIAFGRGTDRPVHRAERRDAGTSRRLGRRQDLLCPLSSDKSRVEYADGTPCLRWLHHGFRHGS